MISIGAIAAGLVIVVASATTIMSSNVSDTGHEYLPAIAALDLKQEKAKLPTQITYHSGDYIGKLSLPRLKKSILVYQGTGIAVLRRSSGYYIDSVLPGTADNSVIAGHRDSVFKDFGRLRRGDLLMDTIGNNFHTYKLKSLCVVDVDYRTVTAPTAEATLILSTCYPFRYIGNAPDRFIVTTLLTQ